jgi:phage anti-repressor protein
MDERHAAGMKALAELISASAGGTPSAPARPPAFPSDGLIPVAMGEIGGRACPVVDARLLHSFLDVSTRFNDWIATRISEYGFQENQDFQGFTQNSVKPKGGRPSTEYRLTLGMAKELAMVERNPKGRQVRRYFIECERLALEGAAPAAPKTAQAAQFSASLPAAPLPPERYCTLDDRLYLSFQEIVRGEARRTPQGRLTNTVSLNDAKLLAHACRHAPESGHLARNWRDFEGRTGIPRRGLKRALGNLAAMGYLEPAVERRGEGIFCRVLRGNVLAALGKAGLAWPEGEAWGGETEERR